MATATLTRTYLWLACLLCGRGYVPHCQERHCTSRLFTCTHADCKGQLEWISGVRP